MWEGVGDRTEQQHIDPRSYGHNSVSFPFSWAAQPRAWRPSLSGCWFSLPHLISKWSDPADWTSCAPSYIIVRRTPSCRRHKSHSFNPSTVKVIFWYSSTGCTCYLQGAFPILTAWPRSIYYRSNTYRTLFLPAIGLMSSVRQWSRRPGFNPGSSHTNDSKNATWCRLAQHSKVSFVKP